MSGGTRGNSGVLAGMRRALAVCVTLFLALFQGANLEAATESLSAEVKRLLAAAKERKEMELNLSWSEGSVGGREGAKRFEALFNRIYGTAVKINFTPGPSMTDMAGKIALELSAGRTASSDLLVGTETHFSDLLPRGVLEEYDYTKLSPRIRREFVAPKNIGVEIHSGVGGLAYHASLVPAPQVPKRLEELLAPKWKGKVAATPNAAGLDRWAFRPEWGAERMKAFVRKLSEQIGGLIRCGEQSRVASGEFLMMLGCSINNVRPLQLQGAPIGFTIPEDAATLHFQYLGIPRNSVHPNLSKLFINVVLSEEGQRILYETQSTDHYALPGSQSAAELSGLRSKGIEPLRIDVKFVSEHPEIGRLGDELRVILRSKR